MINMEIANMILTNAGFTVETAENGRIAVDKISASEPGYYDAVLMDIQMPVLAMTANAFKEDELAALEAGMQAHIAKPVDVGLLMKTLASVLQAEDTPAKVKD